uniref:ARAD1C03938p n=1 Tax=Blastobotrys adeninivorans TaxID=409370 RepID=A0A060SZC0_BLAAD
MNFMRSRPSTQDLLQRAYEEAYQYSVKSILLETNGDNQAALAAWDDTRQHIDSTLTGLQSRPPRSAEEKSLMASILDIERQCHDRISFLQNRGYQNNSPYMTVLTPPSRNGNYRNDSNSSNSYPQQPQQQRQAESGYREYVPSPYLNGNGSYRNVTLPPTTYKSDSSLPPQPPPHSAPLAPPIPSKDPDEGAAHARSRSTSSLESGASLEKTQSGSSAAPQQRPMLMTLRKAKPGKLANGSRGATAASAATLAWGSKKNKQTSSTAAAAANTVATNVASGVAPGASPPTVTSQQHKDNRSGFEILSMRAKAAGGFGKVRETSSRPQAQASLSAPSIPRSTRFVAGGQSSTPAYAKSTSQIQPTSSHSRSHSRAEETLIDFDSEPAPPGPKLKPTVATRSTPAVVRPSSPRTSAPKTSASPSPAVPRSTSPLKAQTSPAKKVPPAPSPKPKGLSGRPVHSSPSTRPSTGPKKQLESPIGMKQPAKKKSSDSTDDDEKANESDWDKKVKSILKNLKGVDEGAAKQIMNEIVIKGDEVHWDDIAGLEQAKASLKETVVYPFLRPDLFSGLREPARGMLLFGPPGTGKTMLARAVATESKSTYFSISASSLTSKFLGESEKLVRALFHLAKEMAPSIIFVDEIDSLLSTRSESGEHEASRRIKNEFLVQWSDLQSAAAGRERDSVQRVLVLAATNLPWGIDEAARRRFVRRQYIPLPERETRKYQLLKLLSHQKHSLSDQEIEKLLDLTEGFSGSDITALAKDAAMGPLRSLGEALLTTPRESIRPINMEDFETSLRVIRPSVSKEGLQAFEEWAALYGSSGA